MEKKHKMLWVILITIIVMSVMIFYYVIIQTEIRVNDIKGLSFKIETNKTNYDMGELIYMRVILINDNDYMVRLNIWNDNDGKFCFIRNITNYVIWSNIKNINNPGVVSKNINPKSEEVITTTTWNQTHSFSGDGYNNLSGKQVPKGVYYIIGLMDLTSGKSIIGGDRIIRIE